MRVPEHDQLIWAESETMEALRYTSYAIAGGEFKSHTAVALTHLRKAVKAMEDAISKHAS